MANLFPFNTNWARKAQTDAKGVINTLLAPVMYTPGSTALDDVDYFVTSVAMKNGSYNLAHTTPDVGARNVTVTQTQVGAGEDTNGKITVTGKDLAGATISEEIIPNAGATVAGAKAFAQITSIVGSGWARDAGAGSEDTIEVGFGALIGLPDKLTDTAQVLAASLGNVKEAVAPTVTVSATVLSSNTVDPSSAHAGTAFKVYYLI